MELTKPCTMVFGLRKEMLYTLLPVHHTNDYSTIVCTLEKRDGKN